MQKVFRTKLPPERRLRLAALASLAFPASQSTLKFQQESNGTVSTLGI